MTRCASSTGGSRSVHLLLASSTPPSGTRRRQLSSPTSGARLQALGDLACVRAIAGHQVNAELERALAPEPTLALASIDDS